MKDSFLKKIKILMIGIVAVFGVLVVNKAAMAQATCEFGCEVDLCFADCFNENANRTDLMCCGKPCDPKSYCELSCACGDSKTGGCEECDDGNNTDGDGCSSECLNEGSSSGMLAPIPVTYKKLPYVDLLALEKLVAEDLNIDLTPGSQTMVAVKGFNTSGSGGNTIDLRASAIGTSAWLAILKNFEFNPGDGFDPPQNVTPIINYYGCTYTKAFVFPCVLSSGATATCRARGCRELPQFIEGPGVGWGEAVTDNPMICNVTMGCCNLTAGCPQTGGGAIDGFY